MSGYCELQITRIQAKLIHAMCASGQPEYDNTRDEQCHLSVFDNGVNGEGCWVHVHVDELGDVAAEDDWPGETRTGNIARILLKDDAIATLAEALASVVRLRGKDE